MTPLRFDLFLSGFFLSFSEAVDPATLPVQVAADRQTECTDSESETTGSVQCAHILLSAAMSSAVIHISRLMMKCLSVLATVDIIKVYPCFESTVNANRCRRHSAGQ